MDLAGWIQPLVTVVLRLVGAFDGDADVGGLFFGQDCQFDSEFVEVEPGDFFVQFLRKHVDAEGEVAFFEAEGLWIPQSHLSDCLVRKAVAHDERWVTGGTAEVHQSAFSQHDDRLPAWVDEFVDGAAFHVIGLDVDLFDVGSVVEVSNVDLVIEVTDVADDGVVLHLVEVLASNDVGVSGCRDEDVSFAGDVFKRGDLEAFHRSLQSIDWINFRDDDSSAEPFHGGGTALAYITVATDDDDLTGDHDVGRSFDSVGE